MTKLKKARFFSSEIDSIEFVKNTPELESLNLHGIGHTFKNYEPLCELKKLKDLDIYMNKQATDENLALLVKLVVHLERPALDLGVNL